MVELRSGFPYTATDVVQNYVIRMNPKYTVRLSVSAYNLGNHFNPEADPAYGLFFAQRGRRFTADLDFLF